MRTGANFADDEGVFNFKKRASELVEVAVEIKYEKCRLRERANYLPTFTRQPMGQQLLTLFGKKEVLFQKFQFPKAEDFNLCRPGSSQIQVRLPYVKPQSSWMKTIFFKDQHIFTIFLKGRNYNYRLFAWPLLAVRPHAGPFTSWPVI